MTGHQKAHGPGCLWANSAWQFYQSSFSIVFDSFQSHISRLHCWRRLRFLSLVPDWKIPRRSAQHGSFTYLISLMSLFWTSSWQMGASTISHSPSVFSCFQSLPFLRKPSYLSIRTGVWKSFSQVYLGEFYEQEEVECSDWLAMPSTSWEGGATTCMPPICHLCVKDLKGSQPKPGTQGTSDRALPSESREKGR